MISAPGDDFLLTWVHRCSLLGHSRPGPLVGAIRALVLLDMLSSGGRDLDALAMVPLLAVITADPELVLAIVGSASSTQGVVVLFRLIPIIVATLFSIFGDLGL